MTLEATQEGVSQDAPEEEIEGVEDKAEDKEKESANPRNEMMNKLYKQADDEYMADVEEPITEEPITEEPVADNEPEEESPVEMVTIKVDGEEREVPRDDIYEAGIRTLQKESAADKRLAEASEILKLAKEKAEKPLEIEDPDLSEDQDGEDDFGKRFVKSFYEGEEDEAAEIVNELAKKINQRGETATEEELVNKAVFEMERRSAMSEFQQDDKYAKINDDKALFARWDNETGMLRQEHPDWPLLRVAQEAGDRINNMVGNNVQQTSLDAKRAAVGKTVKPTASVRSQGEPEYKPKTAAEIVAEMRKDRGQE